MDVFAYLDPENYETEEWSRPDEMALFSGFWRQVQCELDLIAGAEVADLCCGTGMSLLGVASHPNLKSAVGVDIEARNIAFARQRFGWSGKLRFVQEDVLDWLPGQAPFDLVLLSSAFHHIEHAGQPAFARKIWQALKPGGRAVFAENIVADYQRPLTPEYAQAVTEFYEAACEATRESRPDAPERLFDLVRENIALAHRGEVEFKVCRHSLLEDMEGAGFTLLSERKLWPEGGSLRGDAGNFVFVFEKP